MGISHERLLGEIESEFPEGVEKLKRYGEPPVSEDYLESLCEGDDRLHELFEEMLEYFYRYTHDVCIQESLIREDIQENLEEIKARDEPRTRLHNAMIDSVKIFARNLKDAGKDATWIGPIDKKNRAGYAYLALSTTLKDIIKRDHAH